MDSLNDRVQLELLSEQIEINEIKIAKLSNELELFNNYKTITKASKDINSNWVNFGNMFWSLDKQTAVNYVDQSMNQYQSELKLTQEQMQSDQKKFQTLANM